jgi:hypothetical protein
MAVNVIRSNAIDCGCGGWEGPTRIGWPLVGRNIALASIAVAVAVDPPGSIPTIVEQHRASASDLIALALVAWLVVVVASIAQAVVRLLALSRQVARVLESAETG